MFGRFMTALAVTLLVLGGNAERGEAEELSVASSTTVANAVLLPYRAQLEKLTGLTLDIAPVGSSNGVRALAEGHAQIAAVSAPLVDVVTRINEKTPGSVDGRRLRQHDIGTSRVAFVLHPSNPVKDLTFEQVTDILAGRITVWSELGGVDLPIELIAEPRGGGIRTMVEKTLGEWGDVMVDSRVVQSASLVPYIVSKMPTAIGIATNTAVDNTVFAVSLDRVIEQPLFLVTKGEPDARLKKLIEAVRSITIGKKAGV